MDTSAVSKETATTNPIANAAATGNDRPRPVSPPGVLSAYWHRYNADPVSPAWASEISRAHPTSTSRPRQEIANAKPSMALNVQ